MGSETGNDTRPRAPGAVVITGAAGGIGAKLVHAILDAGFPVFGVDNSIEAMRGLKEAVSCGSHASSFEGRSLDLTSDGAETDLLAASVARFGRVFGLINNAGLARASFWRDRPSDGPRFWEVELPIWRRFFQINTEAPFRLSSVFARHMIERGEGRIINVTTSLESMLNAQMAPYGPSKAAAEALSAIMANDLKDSGVTVNVVIPGGPTDTQMIPQKASVPRSSLLPPEVMAPPVVWLLSPEASQTSGKRFIAWKWDTAAAGPVAASSAGSPIAWTSLASGSMRRPAV
jgi:NAD(P)-dependent dehydrogenase (short-subunit alcohol dehydrogenase family)